MNRRCTTQEERDKVRRAAETDRPVQISHVLAERLCNDANLAAAYERACVRRSEGAPEWATHWAKGHIGCEWFGRDRDGFIYDSEAPDLRPDLEGPVTLLVVDV